MRSSACLSSVLLVACGASAPPPSGTFDARDVRGNYALTYDDRLTLKLNVAGAVREVTQSGYGGVADFGTVNGQPVKLDLAAFCAKPEVKCPSESFWAKVAIDQPDLRSTGATLLRLQVIDDTQHRLDAGVHAEALGGLVDHAKDDRFLLGLGASAGANQNCLALAVSLAGGRFTRVGERSEAVTVYRTATGQPCAASDGGADGGPALVDAGLSRDGGTDAGGACLPVEVQQRVVPPGAVVNGIEDGTVFLGWAGGCAFGPFLAGATLTLETGFVGQRTGDFDPPPYTPAPVVLPDGGPDAGDAADAGSPDAG